MSLAEKLAQGTLELGLQVSADIQARLLDYVALIAKWNRVHNLTAVRESARMVSAHLLDCLAIVPHLRAGSVLDVGSGAGLPGIPLALIWPQAQVTLLDSNHKKTAFLRQVLIELELKNVDVICERVESWHPHEEFDLVISRGVQSWHFERKGALQYEVARQLRKFLVGIYPFHCSDPSVVPAEAASETHEFGQIRKSARDHEIKLLVRMP